MELITTLVHVIQVIVEPTALKVQTSFIQLFTWITINCSNSSIKDINDCDPNPCTHGSCTDGVNSYTCACDPGYSGVDCNKGTNFH